MEHIEQERRREHKNVVILCLLSMLVLQVHKVGSSVADEGRYHTVSS